MIYRGMVRCLMADLRLEPERAREAEAALDTALRNPKLTRRQRALALACPEVLRRLAHLSALRCESGEVAEDVAADAVPRVTRRLQALSGPKRAEPIDEFFNANHSSLLPLCTFVSLALQGAPTDLRAVAVRIRRMLDECPQDLLARFGPTTYCWGQTDSVETIFSRLQAGPHKRQRRPRRCEPATAAEVEALALRWDYYSPPAVVSGGLLFFDVKLPKAFFYQFDIPWDRPYPRRRRGD